MGGGGSLQRYKLAVRGTYIIIICIDYGIATIYVILAMHIEIGTSHRIQSGIWSRDVLAYYEGQGYTIRDAIHYWYWNVSNTEEGVAFRDVCTGPHCSNTCPEEIILSAEIAETWSGGARIAIAVIVLTIALICLLLKVSV